MRAIEITEPGGPDVLKIAELAMPEPGADDILIKVAAAGVNRPDVFQRAGAYPPPPGASPLPGLEVAGEIVAMGANVEGNYAHKVGDKVCALTPGGGYAEYCTTPAGSALPVPAGLTMLEAAAIPETFFTVWHNVFERGHLKSGDWFLVHGGSSGIGSTAIQLAKAFGAKVIATAGSDEKCSFCTKIGADHAINYRSQDFVEETKAITEKHGADVILSMVGGDYFQRNLYAAAIDGHIVQIAFLQGSKADMDFNPLMRKRLTFTGSTLRPRSDEFKAALAGELHQKVWGLIEKGDVKPIIDKVFPLEQAAQAHELMESSSHMGKIMLDVGA